MPSLWRNRNYLFLLGGQTISSLGSDISQLAFPLLILARTHSPALAGGIGALQSMPSRKLCNDELGKTASVSKDYRHRASL